MWRWCRAETWTLLIVHAALDDARCFGRQPGCEPGSLPTALLWLSAVSSTSGACQTVCRTYPRNPTRIVLTAVAHPILTLRVVLKLILGTGLCFCDFDPEPA